MNLEQGRAYTCVLSTANQVTDLGDACTAEARAQRSLWALTTREDVSHRVRYTVFLFEPGWVPSP